MTCGLGVSALAFGQPLRHEELLAFLRLRTADLLALFELHHERRKHFCQCIAKPPFPNGTQLGDAASYSRCRDPISYFEWRGLRNVMLAGLETCPVGDTMSAGLGIWPAALMLSSKAIKHVMDALPNAVQLSIYDTA